jgi:hypothetical protein
MRVDELKLTAAYKLMPDGTKELLPHNTIDEAMAALRAETDAIPPRPRESFPKSHHKLYDLALSAGITNPIPSYFDRCWYIDGDNMREAEPIGFSRDQAILTLGRGETIYGSKIKESLIPTA